MKLMYSCISLLTVMIFAVFLPSLTLGHSCQKTCGELPIQYPFGTGPGCGDPRFQRYVTCNQQGLTFTTHTSCYPITAVDYNTQIIYISDPSMSTCFCSRPSKGFGLDWDAPFSFHDNNVFALLDCSTSSSPIYRPNGLNTDGNSSTVPLCDNEDAPICSLLYSCRAISTLNIPISTCCVYAPVDLGPSFEMDLKKLHCTSYSGFYSFDGQDNNPERWKYGIALKYKFSVNNDYPSLCADCERSRGACGYTGYYNSFVCSCPDGANTSSDCFFRSAWSSGLRLLPYQTGILLIYLISWLVVAASCIEV